MPQHHTPQLQNNLYRLWLAALVVAALLVVWGYSSLNGSPDQFRADAAAQSGVDLRASSNVQTLSELPATRLPPFAEDAEYLLTAFSPEGIHMISDAEPLLDLLSPGTTLTAQILRRDAGPEVITNKSDAGIGLEYRLDAPYADGANAGVAEGTLTATEDAAYFTAKAIPIMPYTADGRFAPYPTASVRAVDASGQVLASTGAVLPVSSELGCRNCHSGTWRSADSGGLGTDTVMDIFAVHDRRNGTTFAEDAKKGTPVVCASCHAQENELPNLSTAIHGFHATMDLKGAEACASCHPSSAEGKTRFFRDFHADFGLDCTRCHGDLQEHALSLLVFEAQQGKKAAQARKDQLQPRHPIPAATVQGRQPGVNLPVCAGCHNFTEHPDPGSASAFNKWTQSKEERFTYALDNTGTLRCPSCHGAPHALYPSQNPTGDDRDNIQPLQYQKLAAPLGSGGNCAVCHTMDMEYFVHHDRPE